MNNSEQLKQFKNHLLEGKFLKFDDEEYVTSSFFNFSVSDTSYSCLFIDLDNIIINNFNKETIWTVSSWLMEVIEHFNIPYVNYIFYTKTIDNKKLGVLRQKRIKDNEVTFSIYEILKIEVGLLNQYRLNLYEKIFKF